MSVKLVVLLIVISSLIFYSRSWDDLFTEPVSAANDMLTILSENTDQGKIQALYKRLTQKYYPMHFSYHDTGNIGIACYKTLKIKRGLTYELVEKRLLDDLSELFGSTPKIEASYVRLRPHYPLTHFADYNVWYVKRGGGRLCRVSLKIIHSKSTRGYYINKIPNLWLKKEDAGIILSVHAQ